MALLEIETLLLKIKNRRPVVIAGLALLGLLAGYLLVVKPGLGHLDGTKTELTGLQQKVSAYQFVLDSEKKTTQYKTRFSGDKTWLIEQLNTLAEQTGFSIQTILPEDPKKVGDFLDRTSVRIDAEANYHQLGAFISRVESLDAYVKILGVDINAEGNSLPQATTTSPMGGAPAPRTRQETNIYQISLSVGLFNPTQGTL